MAKANSTQQELTADNADRITARAAVKGPVSRETAKEVCGELYEVVHILRSLHHHAREQIADGCGGEFLALTTENLAVRGIQMIDACIEEMGEIPSGTFARNVFEERRLFAAAVAERD